MAANTHAIKSAAKSAYIRTINATGTFQRISRVIAWVQLASLHHESRERFTVHYFHALLSIESCYRTE